MIGERVPMVDAYERITGTIEYTQNFVLPGMLYARTLRSPHPHARIVRIDASRALAAPGVVAVLTGQDLADDPGLDPWFGPFIKDRAPLAIGKVRYVGCSNETAYGLTKSLWASESRGVTRYETIQNNFSLLNRRFEDELANVCRREKVSLLPYSPIAGGVLSATLGSMVAHRNQQAKLALWQTMAWGMLYGSATTLAFALASGTRLTVDVSVTYVASLAYLVLFGSIATFAAWLTLLRRIGAARAGYIGVMVPVAALAISAAFEGFRFHFLTLVGMAVTVVGNVLVLGKSR